MAIKNIIAQGIGFSPGSVKFLPTLGFTIGVSLLIQIPPAEGIAGSMVHVQNVSASSNTVTIRAKDGVHTVTQTIERLSEATMASADSGLLLIADGVSNWKIMARVGT